jgi:hypothetical protein
MYFSSFFCCFLSLGSTQPDLRRVLKPPQSTYFVVINGPVAPLTKRLVKVRYGSPMFRLLNRGRENKREILNCEATRTLNLKQNSITDFL